jgi:hypothetical protein
MRSSIFVTYWSLAEAIDWRCDWPNASRTIAFDELRDLCAAGHARAIGWRTMDHPRGFKPFPDGYQPFRDPPPSSESMFEDIPAKEWPELFINKLDNQLYWDKTRLPVWMSVELPKHELVSAWLSIIDSHLAVSDQSSGERGDDVVYRTGLAGRPTRSWHLIEPECRRRYAAGERHPGRAGESRAEWARTLIAWLKVNRPLALVPKPKSLTNKLAGLFPELEASNRPKP